ncbi:hypothetical protein FQR65_LT15906 [Abscondita terminalis]|nr:hypothetical protein FQR65_LT15906 [Abscondita terminalis]
MCRLEEVVRTMNTLIQQGKILYWGTSEWSAAEIVEAHAAAGRTGAGGSCCRTNRSITCLKRGQKMEADYLTIFKNLGMGTTIWSPLASGLLTGKYNNVYLKIRVWHWKAMAWLKEQRHWRQDKLNRVEELGKLAVQLGVSLPTLAIAWCVRNPNVTTAILGATKESQLLENLKALEVLPLLTPEVLTQIDDIMQTRPFRSVVMVRREFYVIVPPEYRAKGIIPTSLYVNDLMKFLNRDYYVGLLNAAAYHGAAHQQPQNYSIITEGIALRPIKNDKVDIHFYIKKSWNKQDIIKKKVDTGYINISSPELTALDLISYYNEVGGFNRVATVIEELKEVIQAEKS